MEREVRESSMGGEGGDRRVNSFEGNSAILHHSCLVHKCHFVYLNHYIFVNNTLSLFACQI